MAREDIEDGKSIVNGRWQWHEPSHNTGDSTNTSNVQDLKEEVVHLREKQAEMEQKVDEVNARLAVTLGEVASLWQVVEAMQEQLFPTPSHLQRPASRQAVMTMTNSGSYPVTLVASQLYSSTPVAHYLLRLRSR